MMGLLKLEIGDSVVLHFGILPWGDTCQADDGFDIACLHFHGYYNSHFCIDLYQLSPQDAFGSVLHTYIDGCDKVQTVDGFDIHLIHPRPPQLFTMTESVLPTKNTIVGKLESVHGRVRG